MLHGELDMCTAPVLHRALVADRVKDARTVLVDLEGVNFIDLSGLRPLADLAMPPRAGFRLSVTPGPRKVQRLLELSGLRRYLTVVA